MAMKANPTGGINYPTIKKYLIIAITFLSMLIISLITIVICNSNSILNSSSNNKNSVFAEETFAEAELKYQNVLINNVFYQNRLPLAYTELVKVWNEKTKKVYTYSRVKYEKDKDAESYEKDTGITSKHLTYNISTATEYANFCKLTYHRIYEQTGSVTYANVAIGKYVSYPTYKSHKTYQFYHDSISIKLDMMGDYIVSNITSFISDTRPEDATKTLLEPKATETTFELTNFKMNVSLNADIKHTLSNGKANEEHENMLYFKGSFNGNGHTISFQGTDKYYPDEVGFFDEGDTKCYSPFCCFLDSDGEIKNIKLDYSKLNYLLIDDGWTAVSYAGGIVGHNKGTVQSCIVNSPRVYSQRFNSNAYFGALVGVNDGACHNCAVTGEYYIRAHGWNIGHPDGINAYWGSASGANKVSKSVFSASVVEVKDQAKTEDFIRSPADVGKTAGKNQLAYNSQNETFSYDVNNGGIRKTDSSYSGLTSISSEGGSPEETGELWYFASDYDDIPHLRVFLTWKKIFFKSAKESIVKPTVDYIKVPKDAYKFGSKAGADIEIYGQTIKATIVSGYYIAGWNWSESDLTYTVQYGNETIILKFFGPSNDQKEKVVVKSRGVKFPGEYIVLKNSLIEIDTKYYDNDTIESITYKFTAIVDNKMEIAMFIFRGAKTDVLLSSQTYYLKHHPDNKTESFYATAANATTVAGKSAIRIYSPTAVKKRYGITVT